MKNLNKYIGLEYQKYDCWKLVMYFYKEELEIKLPDFSLLLEEKYKNQKNCFEKISNSYINCKKVSNFKIYDCLLFYNDRWGKIVNHVGIYIGENKFLHITENSTSRISILQGYWLQRLYKTLRYVE